MVQPTTLTDVLDGRANDDHNLRFITGQQQETVVSYQSLHARALVRLGVFQEQGVRAGDQLILLLNDNEQFIDIFWACILGGIIPVPVAGGISDEHRAKLYRIHQKLESAYLCTDTAALTRLEKYADEQSITNHYDQLRAVTLLSDTPLQSGVPGQIHRPAPDDTVFIQFSSGSTSTPKGVVLTHRNLLTNINAILVGMQLQPDDRMLSWMPLTHDMGLIGFHLTPVMGGIDHILMPSDLFVRRPGLWLSKADEHKATVLCSPNFGYQHYLKSFSTKKSGELNLSSVRMIFNGAEPISATLCERFMTTLAPYGLKKSSMFPVYGLAEATLAVTFPALDSDYEVLHLDRTSLNVGQAIRQVTDTQNNSITFANVGKPINDCELMISDSNGVSLPETTVGHIKIRGPNVTHGYYREDAINAATISEDGWLDTGDLGFLYQQSLFITGRAKDIIFINGQNYYPHDVEEQVILSGSAEYGKIAITSYRDNDNLQDKLLCFVQSRTELTEFAVVADDITRVINQATGVQTQHVIPVPRIPKTTSGKVQRFRLAQSYLDGEFNDTLKELVTYSTHVPQDEVSGTTISATLKSICDAQIGDATLGVNDNLFEIGISSLTLAQIHEQIEQTWPEQVDITDLFDYPSITELAVFLENKLP